MSFKKHRLMSVATTIALALFFLTAGLLSLFLPWSNVLQEVIISSFTDRKLITFLFGVGLLLAGIYLLMDAYYHLKRHYAFIKIGPFSAALDENLLQQSLAIYWKQNFPYLVPFTLSVQNKVISVVAQFPALPEQEQAHILSKVNQDFENLFARMLGVPHEIQFFAHFQSV